MAKAKEVKLLAVENWQEVDCKEALRQIFGSIGIEVEGENDWSCCIAGTRINISIEFNRYYSWESKPRRGVKEIVIKFSDHNYHIVRRSLKAVDNAFDLDKLKAKTEEMQHLYQASQDTEAKKCERDIKQSQQIKAVRQQCDDLGVQSINSFHTTSVHREINNEWVNLNVKYLTPDQARQILALVASFEGNQP